MELNTLVSRASTSKKRHQGNCEADNRSVCFLTTDWVHMRHVTNQQCDKDNRRYSRNGATTLSRMNLSGYVEHLTIFNWIFTLACCL